MSFSSTRGGDASRPTTSTPATSADTRPIANSIAGADLHVIELTDPAVVKFYAKSVADQINSFRMSYAPQKHVIDLTDWVADIIIETTAQGASLLEVHLIDPAWTMFMRDSNGVSYIDVDDQGFLWPPVEVTFPADKSDATWRLCQCRPSTSLTEANIVLVFEDKIVSELREHHKQQVSGGNTTRAEFLQNLVHQANKDPAYPGDVPIRFKALLPHSTFTPADLTGPAPASTKQKNPPPARKDHHKSPGSGTKIPTIAQTVQGVEISIAAGLAAFANSVAQSGDYNPPPSSIGQPLTTPIVTGVPSPFGP